MIVVRFAGERAATGPLTFGQRNTLNWVGSDEASSIIPWVFTLPPGATLADVAAAFRVLMSRYEALRTRYTVDGQTVLADGELPIEVCPADTSPEALVDRLRSGGVDFRSGLPLRVAVAVDGDVPVAVVAVYSHVAVDFGSVALIGTRFTELAADPASRTVGPAPHQPLDQAFAERSPRGAKAAEAALRYWENHLRTAPQSLYPVPPPAVAKAEHRMCVLTSAAAGAALGRISERTRTSRQVVVLAAMCAVLSWRTGVPRCVFAAVSGNRFRLRLRDYVGSLAQDGLLALDVDTATFDELVGRAAKATLAANTNSMFDATRLWRIIDQVCHQRGTTFTRDFTLNDLSGHFDAAVELPPAPAATEVRWLESAPFPVVLMCNPARLAPDLMLALTVDLRHVGEAETESLLLGVEALLVAAAAADLALGRVGAVTGVAPVERDADWLCVDSCWVRLSSVRSVVGETLPGSRVVAVDGRLVGYVPASAGIRTPAAAHAACLAALPGHHLAMTPGHYVLCASSPADVRDDAAWAAMPVVAEGAGRTFPDDAPDRRSA
ncbi:MAG TPA: condensation domain-containing protein [Pseudonocardiaceae bacterium]|nr:condensation domain-containing protein [Pseudonocardiaceae bacterium]